MLIALLLGFWTALLWTGSAALCPMKCECDDASLRVGCDNANLDVVPITLNPGLKELRLGKNHIKGILASFSVYRDLEYLDVAHNQLVTLGEGNFSELRRLRVLLLHRNMISAITNRTFRGLSSLRVLQLNENFLEEVPPNAFAPLEKLESLDLSQNRLSSIDIRALASLGNLKSLLLRDNRLSVVPTEAFKQVPNLARLDLGLNAFPELIPQTFSHLSGLEELGLDGCGIRNIQDGAFRGLETLVILRLQDNDMNEVPTRQLWDTLRVEELYLGQNAFHELRALAFQRLHHLRTLEINGAPRLEKIARGAFADNPNLARLVLNHNKNLGEIESGAFDGLANLRSLSIRGDAFVTLTPTLLSWDELEFLDIRDNPLACNCSILWLWKLFHSTNFTSSALTSGVSDPRQVRCVTPTRLRERTLMDLPSSEIDCQGMEARRQALIGGLAGAVLGAGALVVVAVKYRGRLANVLKSKWGGGRKEPPYHKPRPVLEDDVLRSLPQPLGLKVTPVTEL